MVAVWRCAILRRGSVNTVMVERETRALSVGAACAGTCSVAQAEGSPLAPSHKYEKSRFPAEYHLDFTLSLTVTARACIATRRQN